MAFRNADKVLGRGWPPRTEDLQKVVQRLTGKPGGRLKNWRAHYNAACTFALPLLPDGLGIPIESPPGQPSPSRHEGQDSAATCAAVLELERAVARADSGYVAQQRDWLLSEDPDLDHLRGMPEFKDFEATTFGSIGSALERGPDIHMWEQSTYVARFIQSAARQMARLWETRIAERDPSSQGLRTWLDEEMAGWRLAEQLAQDGRDSRTRQEVGREIRETGRLPGIVGPVVAHPRFSNRILDRQLASMAGKGQTDLLSIRRRVPGTGTTGVAERIRDAIDAADRRLSQPECTVAVGRGGES